MATFTRSTLYWLNLPVQFTYRVTTRKRYTRALTLTAAVYYSQDEVTEDKEVTWRIPFASKSDYDTLKALFDAANDPNYVFVGHHDTTNHSFTVKFAELDYQIISGLYEITGTFVVVA
jgi:hypothetical protein